MRGAIDGAYAAAEKISFENMHYRRDIGARGACRRGGLRMVYRVYVEKRAPYDEEAQRALAEFSALPGAAGLGRVRILNRQSSAA